MKYYPINLNVNNKNCLVVGGGSVGARKVLTLLKCKAITTVVSPKFSDAFDDLEKQGVILKKREYTENDLINVFLVIGATDNSELNLKISREAKQKGILCNIADNPKNSDFILPSMVEREDLLITISTAGKSPALTKTIRKVLEKEFGDEYGDFLIIMGRIREILIFENHAPDEHKIIFRELIQGELLNMIKEKDYEKADILLRGLLKKDINCQNLLSGDKQ